MQAEINRAMPRTPVRITGINVVGAEAGVASLIMGRSLPLVQDSMSANVAMRWGAQARQLWVCDAMGRVVEVTDLSSAPLDDPMHFNATRDRLLSLAR